MPPALGHVLSLLGAIPKGAGDVADIHPQIPASVPTTATQGWSHIPEQPKLWQLLFPPICLGWGGRRAGYSWAPGSITNNSLEGIGFKGNEPRTSLVPFNP